MCASALTTCRELLYFFPALPENTRASRDSRPGRPFRDLQKHSSNIPPGATLIAKDDLFTGTPAGDLDGIVLPCSVERKTSTPTVMAAAYRAEAAKKMRSVAPDSASACGSELTNGHVSRFSEYLGLSKRDLTHNELVTQAALEMCMAESSAARDLLAIGSKIIEQTFYDFYVPSGPSPRRNLVVAKRFGTFFTPLEVAERMANYLCHVHRNDTLLDPCAGSGMLTGAVALAAASGSARPYKKALLVESDPLTSRWSKQLLDATLERIPAHARIEVELVHDDAAHILADIARSVKAGCDIIMNPPYGRLRFTRDSLVNHETRASRDTAASAAERELARQAATFRQLFEEFSPCSGVPELSKLFLFLAAQCAQRGSAVVAITPDSWMSGKDGERLRSLLLGERLLKTVHQFPENLKLFTTVNQATTIVVMDRSSATTLRYNVGESGGFSLDDPGTCDSTGFPVLGLYGPKGASLLKRLDSLPKIRHQIGVTNARGEADQTIFSSEFRKRQTKYPLVRGEHIQRYKFDHFSSDRKPGFVDEACLERIGPKRKAISEWRVVGRQCSYARQPRRLVFAMVPPGVVVGNSCNYLTISGASEQDLWFWVGLLNSAVLEWFFRARNANNHVANYEIDNLPSPEWTERQRAVIGRLARQVSESVSSGNTRRALWLEEMLEATVCSAFGLDDEEVGLVLSNDPRMHSARVQNMSRKFAGGAPLPDVQRGGFFNHAFPSLSELDLKMIRCVPEGGNWQDIPESVPSARLEQIREMSRRRGIVRTTYYGRLRRDQPSYTISTYFNRPGNGTHVHPIEDRTLTAREAARLQSFPDSYVFFGGEGAVRDQIGNAVPPLLATAVGEALFKVAERRTCVDVFCGAGGLSVGLEAAGWSTITAIDVNDAALQTYAFNRPSVFEFEQANQYAPLPLVLKRNLHESEQLNSAIAAVKSRLRGEPLGLLAGGPPCQGFSHAGFRSPTDSRNDLAVAYLRMAEALQPELFLLENVEGLLTFGRGRVLREITRSLQQIGYSVMPVWRLCAEEYGVPQMRRRVFIVATRSGKFPAVPTPTYARCPGRWKTSVASTLPSPVTVSTALSGLSLPHLPSSQPMPSWFDYRCIHPAG